MRHKFIALLGLVTLAGTSPAWATATLFCEASQKQIEFSIIGIVPHGQGEPFLQVRGDLTASPEGVTPPPPVIELNDGSNTQFWLDETTLNLAFYVEGEATTPFRSALLTIKTQARADEPEYFDGKFHYESVQGAANEGGDPIAVTLDGKVTCSIG